VQIERFFREEVIILMKGSPRRCYCAPSRIEKYIDDDNRNSFANSGFSAKDERDPARSKNPGLLAMVERSHYSLDISPERRAV
jgi:hypothetical protein